MQIHAATTLEDISKVEQLAAGETWDHARNFLAAAPSDPFADHLRWLEDDGHPVACVQVFVHQYPVGRAKLGMCLPEYPFVAPEHRGRGYFRRLMADLFDWMRASGAPLAYDHGRKGLYTGIGFAPCFHHCIVLIRVDDAAALHASRRAEPATEADLSKHEELFRRPFPLGRGMQCRDERWRPRPRCVRVLRGGASSQLDGFAALGQAPTDEGPSPSGQALTITDAWARDVSAAAALLRTLAHEARDGGFGWIRLNTRRDDAVARAAVLAGGELRWCAAQERDHSQGGEDVDAFYLADLRLAVKQLLPELSARWQGFAGAAPRAVRMRVEHEEVALGLGGALTILDGAPRDAPTIRLPRKAMTRAILGYATPTELCVLHEGCDVPDACHVAADALFVAREPHLIHEGYAFAKPHEFGLVP